MSQWPRAAAAMTSGVPPRLRVRLVMPSAGDSRAQLPVVWVADCPLDQERLGGIGEQALGDRQDLQGAGLIPAVSPVPGGVRDRGVFPVQGVEGGEQGRLAVLDRSEQVIGLLAEKGTELGGPWSDHLEGAIWELRIRLRDVAARITYW